jgi:hypothetical protein
MRREGGRFSFTDRRCWWPAGAHRSTSNVRNGSKAEMLGLSQCLPLFPESGLRHSISISAPSGSRARRCRR